MGGEGRQGAGSEGWVVKGERGQVMREGGVILGVLEQVEVLIEPSVGTT